jgi:alkylhydroperoxidase family enzyme
MHTQAARQAGLSDQRVNQSATSQETPLYSERERAVLGWTEALTLLAATRAPDADYEKLRAHFSEEEATKLTVAIGTINVWNRLCVGFRSQHPLDRAAEAA